MVALFAMCEANDVFNCPYKEVKGKRYANWTGFGSAKYTKQLILDLKYVIPYLPSFGFIYSKLLTMIEVRIVWISLELKVRKTGFRKIG